MGSQMEYDESDEQMARAIVDEINVFRRNPKKYAKEMQQLAGRYQGKTLTFPDDGIQVECVEGIAALKDCLLQLSSCEPLSTITTSQAISSACTLHLADMQANNFSSHLGSDGSTPEDRLSSVGQHREQCGENIVFGVRAPKEAVYQMLLDDGSPERGHRANLLNPEFHFMGIAVGRHPSAETAVVIMFADAFKARQVSRAQMMLDISDRHNRSLSEGERSLHEHIDSEQTWDLLMQDLKPAHLAVPAKLLSQVLAANKPKLYRQLVIKTPHFCLGALIPKPDVDPAIVRAFIHRIDSDHDDLIKEAEIIGLCHQYQLPISFEDVSIMFNEVLERRQPGGQLSRAISWSEVFFEVKSHTRWVPVVDVHIEDTSGRFELTVEIDLFERWCNEIYAEFASVCLLTPPPRFLSKATADPTQGAATSRLPGKVKDCTTFLRSVLSAELPDGTFLRETSKVRRFLGRPSEQSSEDLLNAVCLNQRRLWAYQTRPRREAWLKLMRAVGLDPNLPLSEKLASKVPQKTIKDCLDEEISRLQLTNVSKASQSQGSPTAAAKMKTRDISQRVQVREDDTIQTTTRLAAAAAARPTTWEEKRLQTEDLVNLCIQSNAAKTQNDAAPVAYTFEARRQFQQVLSKQQRASDERRYLSGKSSSAQIGGDSTIGPSVLSRPDGVRGHFHNSVAVKTSSASNRWPQSLDVRWDGSHIDHTRAEELRPNPKMSKLSAAERERQFSTYFRPGRDINDCYEKKLERASNQRQDAEVYEHWRPHEFRDDIPQRCGQYGRRAFDPQVRDKLQQNPFGISEIDIKPLEEFNRQQERVQDFLHRSLPPGQSKHFKSYHPRADQAGKNYDMITGVQVTSIMGGGFKRNELGYGQMRHSDSLDFKIYSRPLGNSQMDRGLPLC